MYESLKSDDLLYIEPKILSEEYKTFKKVFTLRLKFELSLSVFLKFFSLYKTPH